MHPGVALFFLVSLMTLRVCSGQEMSLEVCQSMIPEQEASQPQTKMAPPYRLNVSESCFETGRSLQVTLAGVSGSDVFEGFFVQARKPNDDQFSYGKFNSGGDSKIETIDCFNQSDNAIGHLNESGYNFTRTTFEWTATTDVNLDVIEFVATVVLKYNTFWVGLKAQLVRCNDNRDNTSLPTNNDTTSESMMTTVNDATTATTTAAIGNSTTSPTNGTVHTSLSTATPTSMSESNTVAITTASSMSESNTVAITTASSMSENTVAITTASSMSENNTVAITTASSMSENNTVTITTASSMSENNTVAITTASMMNETTSGADRRKYSILSTAVVSSVAFVACLASVRLTY